MFLHQSCRCALCLRGSQSKMCQSPYTSWICGSFLCWQEEQCDKTAGRLASISLTPGTSLDAVHSAGCFKFLTQELSCVIFLLSLLCILTGNLSETWAYIFYQVLRMFSTKGKKSSVRVWFREVKVKLNYYLNISLFFLLTVCSKLCISHLPTALVKPYYLLGRKNPNNLSESWAPDSFHNQKIKQMASASHKKGWN